MPPFADAVSLVHRQQDDLALVDDRYEFLFAKAFGCHIQQAELTGGDLFVTSISFLSIQGGVDEGGFDSFPLERVDLIFHQSNQRRQHQGQRHFGVVTLCRLCRRGVTLGMHQRGDLEAERFSTPGGHDDKTVATLHGPFDNLLLRTSEFGITETSLQDLERFVERTTGQIRYASILEPRSFANLAIQAGCAGHAGAVTKFPSTCAESIPAAGSTYLPPVPVTSNRTAG